MIAEIGLFALILSFLFSVLLVTVPTFGLLLKRNEWVESASTYLIGQCVFIALSYACLTVCFLMDDFSVIYVLSNSSRALPFFYKLCAVWGGHEGSMLLWVAILSVWMFAVNRYSKHLNPAFRVRVLIVLGALSAGFILFLLMTSSPFARQFQVLNTSGRDLNPLLQDVGFLFHPPMLYMGYVGFSVAFSFAIASLWLGTIESSWTKWTRPWTLAAWSFLTMGITLGSWWAYRELGWGGFWFWDPVENASFMPWLVGTALLHSMVACEKRHLFKVWTLLLAIIAFSLSLVGTFLVRSGVLTSVHAFAVDPERGLYILLFLLVVIGGSLILFTLKGHRLTANQSKDRVPAYLSRENSLFLNNILMVVSMLTVLMGTVYPLLIDGLGLGKLSVGAPYFNTVLAPIFIVSIILMGFAVHVRWQGDVYQRLLIKVKWPLLLSVLLPVFFLVSNKFWVFIGLASGIWVIASTLLWLFNRFKQKAQINQGLYGMVLAHCGVGVAVIGISVSTGLGTQDSVKMSPGSTLQFAGYSIKFIGESNLIGPNYRGTQAKFIVANKTHQTFIFPEKRIYNAGQMPMTEAAVDVTPFRDIYVALGEPMPPDAWSIRVYYKPLVRWIWAGGFLMVAGGIFALTDRRYYVKRVKL